MKQFFLSVCICFTFLANAQGVQHVVKAGENLSTIANQYKVSVANIAAANKINVNALLRIGQKLIIPSGNVKPVAAPANSVAKTAAPITKPAATTNSKQHVVVAGETLGKIARQHGVTEKELMTWNNLKSDLIKIGQIISLVNTGAVATPVAAKKATAPKPIQPETVVTKTPRIEKPVTKQTVEEIIKNDVPDAKPQVPETKPVVPPTIKKEEPLKAVVEEAKPIVKQQPIAETPKTTLPPAVSNPTTTSNPSIVGNSFFEQEFKAGGVTSTLNCKSFKTAAGWQDKKYYALTNLVEAGTIIKITANNKSTYAKVLGVLPDATNNTDIPLRISSATAQQLGLDFNTVNQVLVEY